MTSDERDRRGVLAVSNGDPRVGGHGDSGGDAGHDLEGDARRCQGLGLLAAAAEDERVATLQAHHAAPSARTIQDQAFDLTLSRARIELAVAVPGRLADVDD